MVKMDKPQVVVIINPHAGTHGKDKLAAMIGARLDEAGMTHETITTRHAGHAEEIARQYAGSADRIIAVGGDGTVNEVGRALIGSQTALAIIPCGSGNGLARDLQIPMRKEAAIRTAIMGDRRAIDHGMIDGKPFFCTCGTGFDATVSMSFANAGKRGFTTYMERALTELLNYAPTTYRLTADDGATIETKAFLIACANAAQYGNNAFIAPQAAIDDGLMDVTIVEPFTPLDIPALVIQLFTKTIDKNSNIRALRCKHLIIETDHDCPAHFDGDPVMLGKTIDISIVRRGLNVIVPTDKDIKKRMRYTISQRYKMTIEDLLHCTEYIESLNNNIGKKIGDRNREVLEFIKRNKEELLASIQRLANKR